MTDTESMLLRAVLESPGDDTPRLAYADWLDDTVADPERAELIRIMCDERFDARCGQITHPVADMPDIACDCLTYSHPQEDVVDDWCPQCKLRHRAAQILSTRDTETDRHVIFPFTGNGWTGFNVHQYRRGFVAEIRAPLAVLVGGVCGTCRGTGGEGGYDGTDEPDKCPACHGTGRVPSLGRELFERQPVTRVDTDRLPSTHWINGRIRWAFWKEHEPGYESLPNIMPESCVPWQLLEYLDTGYESESAARSALSDALVAHFREQCGLTPLA